MAAEQKTPKQKREEILRDYAGGLVKGLGIGLGIAGAIAGTMLTGGVAAGIVAPIVGALSLAMFGAAPMEFASKSTKAVIFAIPVVIAAGAAALLSGIFAGGALAGFVGAAVSIGLGAGIATGAAKLNEKISGKRDDIQYPENPPLTKVKIAAAVFAAAAVSFGAWQVRDNVRDLPGIRDLYNRAATQPQSPAPAATPAPLQTAAPNAPIRT
jgi:hypothetical protein